MKSHSWHQVNSASATVANGVNDRICHRSRVGNIIALVFIFLLTQSGCSTFKDIIETEQVKPWQRGTLARDDMQLNTDRMRQSVDDHIYFSKEASTGGSNVQGGGCGCN